MSRDWNDLLAQASEQGLIPANATPAPLQESRPWPLVLLTALGAWLAAIPLLVVLGLMTGAWVTKNEGAYVIGMLSMVASIALLRVEGLPVFLEQLAFPLLLVGCGLVSFGLMRDLSINACGVAFVVMTTTMAALVPQRWLRTLLGAAAAAALVTALWPSKHTLRLHDDLTVWVALHVCGVVWLCLLWLQQAQQGTAPHGTRVAAAIECFATGWLLQVLCGLALLSGMTFLVGGVLNSRTAAHFTNHATPASFSLWSVAQLASIALSLAGAYVAQRAWPAWRQPLATVLALAIAGLCYFMPTLGGALALMAVLGTSGRWRQATAAAVAAAWIVGSFYYQLTWPLATKAMVLAGVGALLGLLAWLSLRAQHATPATNHPAATSGAAAPLRTRYAMWLLALAGGATLAVANIGIAQKEHTIAQGRKVYVALAPVDPRSLMQGDYMRLRFALPPTTEHLPELAWGRRPVAIGQLDDRGVVQWLRVQAPDEPIAAGEIPVQLTPKDGRWTLVTDAWYFREGDAELWQTARFGEFRVEPNGRALMVGMADANLRAIGR